MAVVTSLISGPILNFIKNNFISISLFITVGVMSGMIYFKDLTITSLKEQLAGKNATIESLEEDKKLCNEKFDELSKDIKEATGDSDKILQEFATFREDIDKKFNNQSRNLNKLRESIQTPKTCEESIQLLRENTGGFIWKD
jgi:peptidoglycan hydrolase CwlO-like protein